ncbi:hypothetical protein ACFFGT_09870 [Mucilaginibacter angelicae]|uniref:Nal1 C-terminal domain-containing protein n=1 Tax=Mucilaginibacter angelicae TaxID=869718 RepID=A0ABV6L4V2_9SPHI
MKTLTETRGIREKHSEHILGLPYVTAIGVGYIGNRQEKKIGIIVYQDAPSAAPRQVPETIEGVPVEIRQGHFAAPTRAFLPREAFREPLADIRPENLIGNPRDKEFEPMIGGVSVNPDFFYFDSWQGTLGLAIRDKNGKPVILSNRHVICGKNPVAGDGVSQPSYEFFSHLAASLVAWNLGDVTYQGKKYGIDAAIASPTNGRTATIGKIYGLPDVAGTADAALGMEVTKSGLTTDVTTGTVTAIDVDCISNTSGVILSRQIIIENNIAGDYFSESGDSGSAIIQTKTNHVTGLLWGGNKKTKETMCSPIAPILDFFECTI